MKIETLEQGNTYHIYNRGVNGGVIFQSEENYHYFLRLFRKHVEPLVTLYAYCLLKNHFHFAICITGEPQLATQGLSNFFNAYTKGYNKAFERTGSLFEKPFRRKNIKDEAYLKNIILYIHKNPENHRIIENFENYSYSSYGDYLANKGNFDILELFGGLENFAYSHKNFDGNLKETELDEDENFNASKSLEKESMKDKFYHYIQNLQDTITLAIESIDGQAKFKEDLWKRQEGGGGRTRTLENGAVFEKGGVNISAVHGVLPTAMEAYFKVSKCNFFACGLSLVLHPHNPFVPTVHANWRYFEMYDESGAVIDQWFGGGQDLTPYYLSEDDAVHFHQVCKKACDEHDPSFYTRYKERCDSYFYNSHRKEGRGLGGLFFDYCKEKEGFGMEQWYNFVTTVGDSFLEAYLPIVKRQKDTPFTREEKDWQEIRRGRYVEFNLVHDKGTLFGLRTNGRIESILMSLPPKVQWRYDHHPEPGSREDQLLEVLKNPKDWV